MTARLALRGTALFYLAAPLVLPVGLILYRAFEKGLAPVIDSLTTPQGLHDGVKYIETLLNKVPVQDKSARESLQTFQGGKGDVLLAYENEAILAKKKGLDVDYTIPEQTLLIQNPIAVAEQAPNKAKADAFVKFLTSEPGQRIFVEQGYRPVLKSVDDPKKFPTPAKLFTIDKLGGWDKVVDRFFDEEKGVVTKINEKAGQATE